MKANASEMPKRTANTYEYSLISSMLFLLPNQYNKTQVIYILLPINIRITEYIGVAVDVNAVSFSCPDVPESIDAGIAPNVIGELSRLIFPRINEVTCA